MPLKDTFAKLKTSIVGTKTSAIDTKLDQVVRDIVSYKSHSGRNGYIELVKSLISKSDSFDLGQNKIQAGATPATMGQGSRLLRYKSYDAIISHINYCQRALDVITDNVLAPDDITKVSLEITPKTYLENTENAQSNVKDVEEIIKKIKLEKRLDIIVKNTLAFGDFFCEIADSKTALTSKSAFLAENVQVYNQSRKKEIISENIEGKSYKIILDFSSLDDITKSNNKNKVIQGVDSNFEKQKNIIPEDLHLLFYDPKRVVKLQSDMFPICFGYLIFPAAILSPQLVLQNQVINTICKSILNSLKNKIPGLKDENINTKDIGDVIALMLKETDYSKEMNIRYVSPDRIQHFCRPTTKYYPYGESIFDPCQFNAKVLIAMETALTLLRLNRSIEKRKVTVEIGLPRDAKKAIEKIKEDFKHRKISLDTFGSVDTIPCLDLKTELRLTNGEKISLEEMIRLFDKGYSFEIYAYDHKSEMIVPDKVVSAKITGKNVKVIKIILDNDKNVVCTEDHYWMMRDGSYKMAKDLSINDSLMSLNRKSTGVTTNKGYVYDEMNCKVKFIQYLNKTMDVGDIQTEKFHNFGLDSGIFVHNSQITSFEDIFLPQKDGKSFVDISSWNEGMADTRSKVDELKFIRDSIVASLGVPAPFLGLEENTCLILNTNIPLLNGNTLSLEEIIQQYEKGVDDMYVYSYDHKTEKLVPGKITWAGKTRLQTKLLRIHLDNEKFVDCTEDHLFMKRDRSYIEAKDLKENDSLMPFYIKNYTILNHKVIRIEILNGLYDTGDITIEKFSNFVLDVGVIVHNSNKNQLSEENILFARTIVNHQKYLTTQVQELIQKVYEILNPEKALTILDDVLITFSSPKSLQFERESAYMSNLANLVETLERIGIPKEWSKKHYLTGIDWIEVEQYKIEEKIGKHLSTEETPYGEGPYSGIGGGLMGGGLMGGGNVGQ